MVRVAFIGHIFHPILIEITFPGSLELSRAMVSESFVLKRSHLDLTCYTLRSWQHSVGRIHFSCAYAVIKFMSGESPSWKLGVISWLRRKRLPSNRCKIISQHPNIHPSGRAYTHIRISSKNRILTQVLDTGLSRSVPKAFRVEVSSRDRLAVVIRL